MGLDLTAPSVIDLFARQARSRPQTVAVMHGGTQLSYLVIGSA